MKYWLFRMLAWVVPLMPYWLLQRLAYPAGWLFYVFAPGLRAVGDWNLAHIPGLKDDPERRRKALRGVFVHLVWNYLDFLRGHILSDAAVLHGWHVVGIEGVREVLAQGKGYMLFSGHFGPFELGMSYFGAQGFPVKVPAERMKPESVYRLFVRLREHHGFKFMPADAKESALEVRKALHQSEVVGFAIDRYVAGSATARLPFFGEVATFAIGPAAIAITNGAPIGTALCWRAGFDDFHGTIEPIEFHLDAGESVEEGAIRVQQEYLRRMERMITQHPEQWVSALSRVWKRDERAQPVTIEKQVAHG